MRPGSYLAGVLFTLILFVGTEVLAGSGATRRRMERRSEANHAIAQIVSGEAVDAGLSRLTYLGEEAYAFGRLRDAAHSLDDRQRRDVAKALAALARPGQESVFLSLLDDRDGAVRMYAVRGLGNSRSKNARAVEKLLDDKTMGVRREAARVLGGMRQRSTGRALMRAAQAEGEPEVRVELLHAVGQSGDRRQIKPLVGLLSASSELTRLAAARALCHLSAPEGIRFARKLLDSDDAFERRQGVMLFEGASAKVSRKHLRPMLKDKERAVAASAARVLHLGGEPKMVDWLVIQAARADRDERHVYRRELDALEVSEAREKAIRKRAGLR